MDKNKLVHENQSNAGSAKNFLQRKNTRRNFLIIALVVTLTIVITVSVTVIYFILKNNSYSSTNNDTNFEQLISREEWGADPPKSILTPLESSIKRIIIAHSGGAFCNNKDECRKLVKEIQQENSHLDDIPYNFLIGGDGRVYEGRGFDYEGQHTANLHGTEYNSIGICVAFIGNFSTAAPSENQMRVLTQFIDHYVRREISESFIILSQDSLIYKSVKADALNEAVGKLENFYSLQKVYRREEWGALAPTGQNTKFNEKKEMAMLSHTVTGTCDSFDTCATSMRSLQRGHMVNNGWIDYGFNFGIGGNGLIFESRGFDYVGAHMPNFNTKSIGIGAMGNFNSNEPSQEMINALKKFLEDAAMLGKLPEDFRVHGRQDFGSSGPGENIMKYIREWCRYGNRTETCDPNEQTTIRVSTEAQTTPSVTVSTSSPHEFPQPEFLRNRLEWNANLPKAGILRLSLPIKRIIIAQTGGISCDDEENCKAIVKEIQTSNSHLDDIPYNFLIGNDGKVYEGRGFNFQGQHTLNLYASEFNSIGICVAFIGNYQTTEPSADQMRTLEEFIEFYILNEIISENYIIVIQDDLMYKSARANALNEVVSSLKNFYPFQKVYRREEWEAAAPTGQHTKFSQDIEMAMLSHTVTPTCDTALSCAASMRSLQRGHMVNNGWIDFGFNFVIGGDGFIFESRGFDYTGAHMSSYNTRTIGIAAIGNFDINEPSQGMLDALKKFLEDGAALGKLTEDFRVHGRVDFGSSGPGNNIMKHIREWCRYGNRTIDSENSCI